MQRMQRMNNLDPSLPQMVIGDDPPTRNFLVILMISGFTTKKVSVAGTTY